MKEKPIVFNLLSFLYFSIAISIPIQIAYLYKHDFSDYNLILHKISIFNWLVIVCSIYSAYLLYEASSKLKFLIPLNIFIIMINNWFVSFSGVDYTTQQTNLATISLALFSSLLIFSKARNIIKNQKLIWWKFATRVKKKVPVTIMLKNKELYKTNTFDLSRTGAYLQYSKDDKKLLSPITTKILKGETVEVVIGNPESKNVLICKAKVIRKSEPSGNYPKGIGINFQGLTIKKALTLFKILHNERQVLT